MRRKPECCGQELKLHTCLQCNTIFLLGIPVDVMTACTEQGNQSNNQSNCDRERHHLKILRNYDKFIQQILRKTLCPAWIFIFINGIISFAWRTRSTSWLCSENFALRLHSQQQLCNRSLLCIMATRISIEGDGSKILYKLSQSIILY